MRSLGRCLSSRFSLVTALMLFSAIPVSAQVTLHERIDRAIAGHEDYPRQPAAAAPDAAKTDPPATDSAATDATKTAAPAATDANNNQKESSSKKKGIKKLIPW